MGIIRNKRAGTEERRARVLLVAGEVEQLHKATRALTRWGCEVVEAGSGAELLAALWLEGGFDLIITAARLPDVSGLEVLAGLRGGGGPDLGNTRFVLVAAREDREAHVVGARLLASVVEAPLNLEKLGLQAAGLTRSAA